MARVPSSKPGSDRSPGKHTTMPDIDGVSSQKPAERIPKEPKRVGNAYDWELTNVAVKAPYCEVSHGRHHAASAV